MSKRASPPPRPPAPKVGGGGGISFSFKALEEESDDELTILTGKFDKQVSDSKEKQLRDNERERSHSKSPDTKHLSDSTDKPGIRSQKSLDKIMDLKGKIQDSITKKFEELSADSPSKTSREKTPEPVVASEMDSSINVPLKADKPAPTDNGFNIDTEYFVDPVEKEIPQSAETDNLNENELEIDEEYYNPDAEDFSELPGVVTPVRQRKRFQKFRKIKPVIPPSPVSMSRLSQRQLDTVTGEKNKFKECDTAKTADTFYHSKSNESVIEFHGAVIPVKKLVTCAIIFLIYLIIPLPSYLSGMIVGAFLSSGAWLLYLWVVEPPKPREPIPEDQPLEKLPPLPVPEMKEPKGEDCTYKGWMNEIADYCPSTYSINLTHSVYVDLEGTAIRLRRPKVNVPKRAMWDEPTHTPQFIHQRHFDLEDSKILLVPPGLVKKRLWSKKYPICIALAKDGRKHSVKTESQLSSKIGNQSPTRMVASSSVDSVHGFELINEQKCDTSVLYLFARTCHEKEQWFKRFQAAAKGAPLKNHIREINRVLSTSSRHHRSSSTDSLKHKRQESSDSLSSIGTNSPITEEAPSSENDLREFVMYISRLVPRDRDSLPPSPAHPGKQDSKSNDTKPQLGSIPRGIICDPILLPLNALLGRCFWDFLRDQYWQEKVKDKLQKKLSKIHIPYFIEELKISDIDLGAEVPVIRRANCPYLDENGFWVDLDLTYSGKFKMTIETKVNLLRLKQTIPATKVTTEKSETRKSAVLDSEEEDSAESSTDEEEEVNEEDGTPQGGTGKKLMKYINKITASKYFQSATENRYIKKAMTEVSNTRLILTVEVQKLNGTLAINIPAPPTDRLWYGFRGNPQLWLVAKPKVGEREVTMSHITEWIEKKLASEFQLVLVMPNMDDFVIPILLPGQELANNENNRYFQQVYKLTNNCANDTVVVRVFVIPNMDDMVMPLFKHGVVEEQHMLHEETKL